MKVYVLEKGQYSDRHIIGVVDSKEKAEKISHMLDATSTEWDTEQFEIPNNVVYEVYDPEFSNWTNEWEACYDDWSLYSDFKDNKEEYEGHYIIHANTPEQAIKIAQDMKAEKLANETGIV